MITKYVDGHTTTNEDIMCEDQIDAIAHIFRSFHSHSINHSFDPFKDISQRFYIIQKQSTISRLKPYVEAMTLYNSIKDSYVFNDDSFNGLCHNDSNIFNLFISSEGKLYLIDYE